MPKSLFAEIIEKFKDDPRTTRLRTVNAIVHIAVLVYRGKIIAKATNRIGYRSKGDRSFYNTSIRAKKNIHAEENVVRVLGDHSKLRDADMYVMRFGHGENKDTFINSKPCAKCECFLNKCMREYGLRHVYYTS
jgi:hypothetical protein